VKPAGPPFFVRPVASEPPPTVTTSGKGIEPPKKQKKKVAKATDKTYWLNEGSNKVHRSEACCGNGRKVSSAKGHDRCGKCFAKK